MIIADLETLVRVRARVPSAALFQWQKGGNHRMSSGDPVGKLGRACGAVKGNQLDKL